MDEAKRDLVQSWLLTASNDLAAARLLTQAKAGNLECGRLSLPAGGREGGKGIPGFQGSRSSENA